MTPPPNTARTVGRRSERAEAGEGRLTRGLRGAWSWWAARPTLAAAVIYAVLSLIFVGQGLLPGRTLSSADYLWSVAPWETSRPADVPLLGSNFEPADAVVVFQPYFEYSRDIFPDIPLWNPYIMAGRPFLANSQSAVFSPFTFPAYVLPLSTALGVIALLKLFVAAFATFLFARTLGLRFGGALLAGIVFTFGTFFAVWLPWTLTNIYPLIPLLLLTAELLVRRPGLLPAVGLAVLVTLQFFGGHPETSFHLFIVVAVFFAFRLTQRWLREGRDRRVLVRPTVAFVLAVAVGSAAAAITLLPLAELFLNSGDYARRQNIEPSSMDRRFFGHLFLYDYWGRPTQTSLAPFVSNRGLYAGGLTLMLAAVALVLRPTATRIGFAVFGVLVLLVVFGVDPFFAALTALPGFAAAHNARTVIFFLLVLAMLAGWGLDDLTERLPGSPSRRRVALGVVTAIFCVPFAWMLVAGTLDLGVLRPALDVAWGFAGELPANPLAPASATTAATVRLSALLQWLVLAGAGLAIVALRLYGHRLRLRRVLPAAAFVAVVVTIMVADLFRANMGYNTAIPVDNAEPPATGAIRYLQSRRPARFAGFDPARNIQPLQPDLAMRYKLYDARGYDYPVVERYDKWWRATAAPPEYFSIPTSEAMATPRAVRGMSLLSVADIIQDPTDPPVRLPGLELAYSGRDARVYRNRNALPRAFVVNRQQLVPSADAALNATLDRSFEPRRVAITEKPIEGIPRADVGGQAPSKAARLVRTDPERVVVRARAAQRSLLVLTDVDYPGWKATVDGQPADIEPVDYLLRGVAIPAGTHEVEFSYEPTSWRIGWIISALASLVLLAAAAVGWRRRRTGGQQH